MADLAELIEKVKAATGEDREIDAAIYIALVIQSEHVGRIDQIGGLVGWWPVDGPYQSAIEVPRYTASLDAVVALAEEVLPGWALGFDCGPKTCMAFCDPHDYEDRMFGGRYIGEAKTPALALLLAILTAKQEASNG